MKRYPNEPEMPCDRPWKVFYESRPLDGGGYRVSRTVTWFDSRGEEDGDLAIWDEPGDENPVA